MKQRSMTRKSGFVRSSADRVAEDKTSLERFLQITALFGVLTLFFMVFYYWSKLPDSIPSHFGFSGKPDDWSGKGTLVILPILSLLIYIGLTTLTRYPHLYNFPWKITEENRERQIHLARLMLHALNTEVIWLFTYIDWQTIQIAMGKSEGLGPNFIFVFLGIVFGTTGLYLFKAIQAR